MKQYQQNGERTRTILPLLALSLAVLKKGDNKKMMNHTCRNNEKNNNNNTTKKVSILTRFVGLLVGFVGCMKKAQKIG